MKLSVNKAIQIIKEIKGLDLKKYKDDDGFDVFAFLDDLSKDSAEKVNKICSLITDKDKNFADDLFDVLDPVSDFFLYLTDNVERSKHFNRMLKTILGLDLVKILNEIKTVSFGITTKQ